METERKVYDIIDDLFGQTRDLKIKLDCIENVCVELWPEIVKRLKKGVDLYEKEKNV